jgi:exodeoxyribonuclease III
MSELILESYNVNGIRAVERKGFLGWLAQSKPDILCLQETKAHREQLSDELLNVDGYQSFFNSGERKGYSGVAVYSALAPGNVVTEFPGILNDEGRVIRLDYSSFVLLNVYFPNGKKNAERLAYKMEFYQAFREYVSEIRGAGHEVLVCGDVNTAHKEIDLARPKPNERTSGFLPEERAWISEFLADGFVDTFRVFDRRPNQYSWWDMKSRARERNVGWRIDYWFCSEGLSKGLRDAYIKQEVDFSDHSPVGLVLEI